MNLRSIVAAPSQPRYGGSSDDWRLIEAILEMELPSDFKDLINDYGGGCFSNFLYPLSPFAPFVSELNLLSGGTKQILSAYDEGRREYPEYSPPFEAYPKKPGLFPWAKTVNGDVLFWLTRANPSVWPVVVCDSKFSEEYDLYETNATGFLCCWINKEINPKAFPKNIVSVEPAFKPSNINE